MTVDISFGSSATLQIKHLLAIYEGDGHHCAMLHDPITSDGVATCGTGRPISRVFLKSLARALNQDAGLSYLPETVLAMSSDSICWWSPACTRPMFFSPGAGADHLIGKRFPQPPLLWVANASLSVFALTTNERPAEHTPIAVAPFWNTCGTDGKVCLGNMPRPQNTNPSTITDWMDGFYVSAFSHATGSVKLTTHPEGLIGMWNDLIDSESFPTTYLVKTKRTVKDVLHARD